MLSDAIAILQDQSLALEGVSDGIEKANYTLEDIRDELVESSREESLDRLTDIEANRESNSALQELADSLKGLTPSVGASSDSDEGEKTGSGLFGFLSGFSKFFPTFSTLLGPLGFLVKRVITPVLAIKGAIEGFIEGYKKEGLFGGLKGALSGAIDSVFGWIPTVVGLGIEHVMKAVGLDPKDFPMIETLKKLDLKQAVEDFVDEVAGVVETVIEEFKAYSKETKEGFETLKKTLKGDFEDFQLETVLLESEKGKVQVAQDVVRKMDAGEELTETEEKFRSTIAGARAIAAVRKVEVVETSRRLDLLERNRRNARGAGYGGAMQNYYITNNQNTNNTITHSQKIVAPTDVRGRGRRR